MHPPPPAVIVAAFGSAGDVFPMMALAQALQQRGHAVTMLTASLYEPLARQLNLAFQALNTKEIGTLEMARPNALDAFSNFWYRIGQGAAATVDMVQQHVSQARRDGRPDPLLVGCSWAVGCRLAGDAFHLRTVTVHMSPCCVLSGLRPPKLWKLSIPQGWPLPWRRFGLKMLERFLTDPIIRRHLKAQTDRLCLPPLRHALSHWIHSPDRVLNLYPEWFCPLPSDAPGPTRLIGFPMTDLAVQQPITPELRQFLAQGDAPIVFATGSSMRRAEGYFSTAVQICQQMGRRGLLLSRHTGQIPALPPGLLHQSYAPYSQVLGHACALVSHGGIGTCSHALRLGVPQLILPYAHDQFDNAHLVQQLGVGTSLPSNATASSMARALHALLSSPTVQQQCRAVSQQMAGDRSGIDRGCEEIEALMGSGPSARSTVSL